MDYSTPTTRVSYVRELDRLKVIPFKRRLADREWPMAFAHYIPFFSVYYAITRRTITPMAWQFGLNLMTGLIVMLANYETEMNKAAYGSTSADPAPFIAFIFVASLALDPVAVRLGIKSAKQDARRRLDALGQIEGDIQQDKPLQQIQYSQSTEPQVTPRVGFQARLEEGMRIRNSKEVAPQPQWQEPSSEPAPEKPCQPLENRPIKELPKSAVVVQAPPAPSPDEVSESLEQKLIRIKQWADQGLISEEEAKALRQKELGLL